MRLLRSLCGKFVLLLWVCCAWEPALAAAVAVHDPSVVVAYKDGAGNTYPENDALGSRTKYYYIFGTQLGAAYSTDMLDWTAFTPTFAVNGQTTTDYLQAFQAAAAWSGHATVAALHENLWAPDIIYNKALGKWCLYYSVNGENWMSSVTLHTAERIEGPYSYAGTVVYSGMDLHNSGAGHTDYRAVTGETGIAARYLDGNGQWTGTYGSSCIDPAVSFDAAGRLWLVYGSWSGGIFLLKLDASTGLRDRSYNYGYGSAPVWDGTRLRYDPYMGVHLAGGHYVSGEGPYLRYLEDPDGQGYYYLFVSMGFYSPEGGYSMRVFRSPTIDGKYTDASGHEAVAGAYVFNYGANTQYGFPIMQNYKWSWWSLAEIAQGHNSVLRDEDGVAYLLYHRKMDNQTAFHNVETHQLFFNDQGWIMAAPFEFQRGFGLEKAALGPEDLTGSYGVIAHKPVDYAALASNAEQSMELHADGTVTGASSGSWTYSFAGGRHFLNLVTTAGTFRGVVGSFLMNGRSARTVAFTAMDMSSELALWGYRRPLTESVATVRYTDAPRGVGTPDRSLRWDDYGLFYQSDVKDEFTVEYVFTNHTAGAENWHNWALVFKNGEQSWHLRADAWSIGTFKGSTVGYKSDWKGTLDFRSAYAGKEVRLKAVRRGTTIEVFAYANGELVYTASARGTPAGNYSVLLGGENCFLELRQASAGRLEERVLVGSVNDDAVYTAPFHTLQGGTTTVAGDFHLRYLFHNYRNSRSVDNWENYRVRVQGGGRTMLLRADALALDATGDMAYSYDWEWDDFNSLLAGAQVELDIARSGTTVTYAARGLARDGRSFHYKAVNSGATADTLRIGFTVEESMVDLLRSETLATVSLPGSSSSGAAVSSSSEALSSSSGTTFLRSAHAPEQRVAFHFVYDLGGKLRRQGQGPAQMASGAWIVVEIASSGELVRRSVVRIP